MATVRLNREHPHSHPVDLAGGYVLSEGEVVNIDLVDPHNAALLADGLIVVVDPDVPPPPPDAAYVPVIVYRASNSLPAAGKVLVGHDDGLLPTWEDFAGALPALAITDVQVVDSEAEQLALDAEQGDVVVRTDEAKTYVHNGGDTGTLDDWTWLATPGDVVVSVAGKIGAVVLAIADVGGLQAALDAKQDAAGAATDAELAAHAAASEGVHGLPNATALQAIRRNAGDTAWEGFDPATQTELDAEAAARAAADALKQDAATAATDAELTAHTSRTDNPHATTKAQVGLGNADNTSDANKPVSTAQAAAIATKQDSATAATDAELADHADDQVGVHGFPPPVVGESLRRDPDLNWEGFDPASQAELDAHKASADHDGRYFTEAETTALLAAKQDAATAATDAELAAHAALSEGVHGLPNATALQALRRNAGDTAWEGFDVATQAELDAALALKQDAATAATDAELADHADDQTGVHGFPPPVVGESLRRDPDLNWEGYDPASQAELDAVDAAAEKLANKGAVGGYASLDGAGRVPASQLPVSAMEYKGNWNAATNTPALADGAGSTGDQYRVSVAASRNLGSGAIQFDVGDYAIYNGATWEKADTTDAVSSVAGKTGAVALVKGDVGLGNVDNTSDVNKPVSTAQQTALNLKQDAATAATDAELAAHTGDVALDGGPHGLPALGSDGLAWVRQGGALVAVNIATQAELDAHIDDVPVDRPHGLPVPVVGRALRYDADLNLETFDPATQTELDAALAATYLRDQAGLALVEFIGHSYQVTGGVPRDSESYPDRLCHSLAARRRFLYAMGGSVSCWPTAGAVGDGGYAWVLQQLIRPGSPGSGWPNPGAVAAHPETPGQGYPPRSQLVVHHQAYNDLTWLGAANPRPMKEAHRTIWSAAAAAAIWEDTVASWVYTGTWSNVTSTSRNSGPQYKSTTTLNDKATFTVPADWPAGRALAIVLPCDAAKDATIGVKVNGVAKADARLQGSVLCDQSAANKHNAITLRFRPTAWGASLSAFDYSIDIVAGDTVELTLKTQTIAASPLHVDRAHIESDPLDGPVIVVPLMNRVPGGGFSSGDTATWNAALQAIGPEFPSRMLFVDLDTPLGNTAAYFWDTAHPNIVGHGIIATAIRDALLASGLLTTRVLTRPVISHADWFEPIGMAAGRVALLNSWAFFGGAWPLPGFRRDLQGRVRTRGGIANGTAVNANVCTLPVGYRRDYYHRQPAEANGTHALLQIDSNGTIKFTAGGSLALCEIESTFEAAK